MPSTEEILNQAQALGKLIGDHEVTQKLQDAITKLDKDTDAQQAMQAYQQTMTQLAQKEMQGQPIEIADKKMLEQVQMSVIHNLTIKQFQMAQVEFTDLMRSIDAAVYASSPLQQQEQAGGMGGGGGGMGGPGGMGGGGGLAF